LYFFKFVISIRVPNNLVSGFRCQGSEFRVQRFRVQRFRVQGKKHGAKGLG
jgi:hypothetical protein